MKYLFSVLAFLIFSTFSTAQATPNFSGVWKIPTTGNRIVIVQEPNSNEIRALTSIDYKETGFVKLALGGTVFPKKGFSFVLLRTNKNFPYYLKGHEECRAIGVAIVIKGRIIGEFPFRRIKADNGSGMVISVRCKNHIDVIAFSFEGIWK